MPEEKYDLLLRISGGCSIPGTELANKLEQFFKDQGFRNIKTKGLKENNKHGWDVLTECESVKIQFNLKG